MSIEPPDLPPSSSQPRLFSWLNRLKAWCRSHRILNGANYTVQETQDGTTINFEPGTGGGSKCVWH